MIIAAEYFRAIETVVKYEAERWDNINPVQDCTRSGGHKYFILDKDRAIEIRKKHPKMTVALWECIFCRNITQSM